MATVEERVAILKKVVKGSNQTELKKRYILKGPDKNGPGELQEVLEAFNDMRATRHEDEGLVQVEIQDNTCYTWYCREPYVDVMKAILQGLGGYGRFCLHVYLDAIDYPLKMIPGTELRKLLEQDRNCYISLTNKDFVRRPIKSPKYPRIITMLDDVLGVKLEKDGTIPVKWLKDFVQFPIRANCHDCFSGYNIPSFKEFTAYSYHKRYGFSLYSISPCCRRQTQTRFPMRNFPPYFGTGWNYVKFCIRHRDMTAVLTRHKSSGRRGQVQVLTDGGNVLHDELNLDRIYEALLRAELNRMAGELNLKYVEEP